ncbi:archaellin/type IV pilin N-terminal domain-containing protein [Natronolimnohabitans innermongolicus]|uniref:Flagellin n=1 Tax=Natronolimnohabitans innermongolicus JCM 12255 TaxID=1227499 RepID=L9WUT8_9EURY|nr:archaellin/type IV pilin N-terminal domain-containing protein [Natronolimnohabitans innermongolicus]ELY53220.1 flagellin [Natronolimnohabitans innermongolicus JCM 12255]
MFETITDNDERGQVGIGTLIVFIAMVLVAAIAAGVLINTAGDLQSQASDTGSETQEQVANQIEVVHATGSVDDSQDTAVVDQLNFTLMKSAGSDVIDLQSMTVQFTGAHDDLTLAHSESESDADGEFTTEEIVGDENSLTNSEDRVKLSLDLSAEGLEVGDEDGLEGGESATVRLVDQSGAQFSYGVSVPSTIDDYEVVEV